jgi:integrase
MSYSDAVRTRVLPQLGSIPLAELTAEDLTGLYGKLLTNGRADGRGGLAVRSVRYTHVILKAALADACRWGLLDRNVSHLASPPRHTSGQTVFTVWSASHVNAFLSHVRRQRLAPLWELAVNTGMRRGELLALRWESIDFEAGRVSITRSRSSTRYVVEETSPKTQRSRRAIEIDSGMVSILKEWRRCQLEERFTAGATYRDQGYVFASDTGVPMQPDLVSKRFDREVAAGGLPRIRFHDLRHTWATLALQAGVPAKVVSQRLGHTSVAITLDVYSHVIPGMDRAAGELVASVYRSAVL